MATAVTSERSTELRGFRKVRRLAHACERSVAALTRPGVTGHEAARTQREGPRERGLRDRFPPPFARFGDRTAFDELPWRSPRVSAFARGGVRRRAEER